MLPPLDPQRLERRGDFGLTEADYRPNLADAWRTARLWGRLLLRQPAVLQAPTTHTAPLNTASPFPGLIVHAVDAPTWHGLRSVAAKSKATVNDILLRDLFLILDHWNAQHGGSRWRPLRVTMPTAIRYKDDKLMPAANLLGFTFLTRSAGQCRDPVQLLRTIRDETAAIKRWRLGLYFLGGLAVASRQPGLLRWQLHRNRSLATAVFSNVGRVFARSPLRGSDGKLCCGDVNCCMSAVRRPFVQAHEPRSRLSAMRTRSW